MMRPPSPTEGLQEEYDDWVTKQPGVTQLGPPRQFFGMFRAGQKLSVHRSPSTVLRAVPLRYSTLCARRLARPTVYLWAGYLL